MKDEGQKFRAVLEMGDRALGWTVARVPFEPAEVWGEMVRLRVRGEVNGFGFRTSLFPDVRGGFYLLVNRAMQRGAGVAAGDGAEFALWPDLEARAAELPDELAVLLEEEEGLREWYDGLGEYTRREIGKWVLGVKGEEARVRRAMQMAERLMSTMEAERELPPLIASALGRRPKALAGWGKMTEGQRRGELMGVFYYQTPESREKRVGKLVEAAEKRVMVARRLCGNYNRGMARLYPFRALRYDSTKVDLEDVVTQPYDKISPEMQQAYYDRSPYNLIRVILGKRLEGDDDSENVYTRAAATLSAWREEGILKEEAEPALYGYSQTYTVPHTEEVRERRGFIALGHLYDYAENVVYRHEQTFPKHKSDRLALFKATRAYCEQIYMLYSDPAFTAEKLIFGDGEGRAADLAITDEYGVVHRVWKLTDAGLINLILTAMADKKLIIADGHHRYETSVAYAKERAEALGRGLSEGEDELSYSGATLPVPAYPEAAMMMTFVNMEAPGITILPTHRVVFGLEGFSRETFLDKAEEFFTITPVVGHDPEHLANTHGTAFLAVTRDGESGELGHHLLVAKADLIAGALTDVPVRQAGLDVVQLHRVVLERLLGLSQESVTGLGNIAYLREASEAVAQVESGRADVAFLIKPVTLGQLRDISLAHEVMPQKSTDFYPKLLSGLAMYTLD